MDLGVSVKIVSVEEVMNLRGNGRHRGVGGELEMMQMKYSCMKFSKNV